MHRAILISAALLVSGVVNAGLIAVSDITASSTFSSYDVNNLINGSGLSGSSHSGDWTTKWMTNETVTGSLIFDLGATYNVYSGSIWNYGGGCCGTARSVKDLSVEVSVDGIDYFTIGDFVLGQSSEVPIYSQTIALNTTASYIKFNLNSNYGDNYTGLSEVQFTGEATTIPEPTTIALLACGLIGIGLARVKTS